MLCAALALCGLAGAAAAQGGFAQTALGPSEGFAEVVPGTELVFPRDHGPHPGFGIEWWYLTANMTDAQGRDLGLQWTLFRQALTPEGPDTGWQSNQLWMGHAAVTTQARHHFAEVFARGGIGQAGVTAAPFAAWIDDWRMAGPDFDTLQLRASGDSFSYDVALRAQGPLVLHGDAGLSVKSLAGQASYYYSQPGYALEGSVTLEGETRQVTGTAWLDREWSSQFLAGTQEGWDWFSLHLGNGDKLMAFHIRSATRPEPGFGTWIGADGRVEALAPGAVTLTPLDTAEVAGRRVPVRWRVELPARGIDIEAQALNPQAWMGTAFSYWEGPIRVSGSHEGQGYLEMTGY